MESEKRYYKIKLCDFYIKNGKCDRGDNCSYAHGKEDLKDFEKKCNFGLKCHKEDCKFSHPDDWNPEDNKKICEYYINGFCKNDDNCKFKHIIEDNNYDIENVKINEKKDINTNITEESINKNVYIKENTNDIKYDNQENHTNLDIFINGIKYTDIEDIKKDDNQEIDVIEDIEKLIFNLQNNFEKYTKDIKQNIDNIFIEDKQKYGIEMKMNLNNIMSEIYLFKHNYQDFIKCSF